MDFFDLTLFRIYIATGTLAKTKRSVRERRRRVRSRAHHVAARPLTARVVARVASPLAPWPIMRLCQWCLRNSLHLHLNQVTLIHTTVMMPDL